jgi:hypothetical protein
VVSPGASNIASTTSPWSTAHVVPLCQRQFALRVIAHTSERRGGVERRQMEELKGAEACRV